MRIISGQYGRRKLEVPKGNDIRPTSDKIRGAIFNSLESLGAIHEARVLDAFSGSGALGIEALSRGAQHCTFIDKSRTSLDLSKRNIDTVGAAPHSDTLIGDASKINFKRKAFDLILLDPPYYKNLTELTLKNLEKQSAILSTATIICETERSVNMSHAPHYSVHSEKIYGDTKVTILIYNESTPE